MLGVFGCVPAFDTYFMKGFGVSTFNKGSLRLVGEFYRGNVSIIDQQRQPTLDFTTGQPTTRLYTRAKVVDMIFLHGRWISATVAPASTSIPVIRTRQRVCQVLMLPPLWTGPHRSRGRQRTRRRVSQLSRAQVLAHHGQNPR